MSKTVAALYVEENGSYSGIFGVDIWPEKRDARNYNGPYPVVAHPPCQRWGALAQVNYSRWGGEHNKPGNDGGCFAAALASVRKFGGVLEHPAKSKAWPEFGIVKPKRGSWQQSDIGFVTEVWQSAYGHKANKATWLYCVGIYPLPELKWDTPRGTHQVGNYDKRGKSKNKPTLKKREALATPSDFRETLLSLARKADLRK